MRFCDLKLQDRTHAARARVRRLYRELDKRADRVPPARVAVGGMVFAGRRAGHRGAVLPGASAPRAARAPHDAQGRGRQRRERDAHPAPRSRPRHRHRLPAAPAQALARSVRPGVAAVSGYLHGAARQPPLRAAPGRLVRAGHPCEDFAETFAVWLQAEFRVAPHVRAAGRRSTSSSSSTSCWTSVRGTRAPVRNRDVIEPLQREHAHARRALPPQARALQHLPPHASPITCSSACSRASARMRDARARQHLPARAQRRARERARCASSTRSATASSRSCASSSSAPRSCDLWVRGSRRDALRARALDARLSHAPVRAG